MIQNIVEDQIQNNSEITAQPIIWREKHVESAPFYTNKQISNFISQTEVSHFQ